MSMNRISRQRAWGVWCLCIVFLMASFSMVSAGTEKASGTSAEADVANWLAELDAHPAAAGLSESVRSGGQARNSGSSKRGRDRSVKKQAGPQKISIDFYKVDLHNVFRLLGKISKKNIVVDEGVKGTLTLALQDVPWTFVLQVIKNLKGLSSQEINNTIMIYPADKKMEWEAGSMADAELDFAVVPDDSSDPGLTVERNRSFKIGRGLDIKQIKTSKVSAENINQAGKLIKKAEAAQRMGDLDTAERLLRQAADLWYDNPELLKKTAHVALKNGDELSGYNYGKKALEINPDDSEAAAITAVALARMNKPGDAKTYFERAMSGEQVSFDTLWNYAVFSFSHNDFRTALRLITRIETGYSLTPDLMMLKARTYENLGRKDKAAQEYRAILTAGKDVPDDLQQFARARLQVLDTEMSDSYSGIKDQAN